MITLAEARRLNREGNVIPLFRSIPSDLDTPVTAFLKLARRKKHSFLLESIEGGEKLARYSFLGFDPFMLVEGNRDQVLVRQEGHTQTFTTTSLDFLKELFKVYTPVAVSGIPRFTGGAVGFFAYDAIRWVERVPDDNPETTGLPEMMFGMYRHIVVFDHLKQNMLVIANILHDRGNPRFTEKYHAAVNWIEETTGRLQQPLRYRDPAKSFGRARVVSECTKSEFETMVRRAKRYIKEGDIFQVVLSQRWRISSKVEPLTVYRRLRRINPSPYMFLLNFGGTSIVGASPEMMVRVEKGEIETRPIAGTRPRGRTEQEDERLSRDLLNDKKELAEHTMLLDLGRNDIGRVSRPGSVAVKERMIIEKYSHVMHIVSSVVGRMRRKMSPLDGHFACFPAGTVSGAPKIRAMEIIDELEKVRRGLYAGSVAYLDFWGNLDSCIAIRTVIRNGNTYFVQAGAGIVADSKPRREYDETVAKASALIEAINGDRL